MSLLSKLFKTIFSDTENNILFSRRDLESEKELYKEMFDNIDGKSLDDNQRTAVVDDSPRQLVVAGAGSGKTLTISAKVKYLVDAKGISPDDILLISFTKKAAAEMHDRIKKFGIEIDSSTFHKYGLSILTQVEHKQPDIADDINVFLDDYLSEIIFKDETKAKDFLSLVGLMMLPITSEESTKGEQIELENLQDLKTLRELAYGSKNTKSRTSTRRRSRKRIP